MPPFRTPSEPWKERTTPRPKRDGSLAPFGVGFDFSVEPTTPALRAAASREMREWEWGKDSPDPGRRNAIAPVPVKSRRGGRVLEYQQRGKEGWI